MESVIKAFSYISENKEFSNGIKILGKSISVRSKILDDYNGQKYAHISKTLGGDKLIFTNTPKDNSKELTSDQIKKLMELKKEKNNRKPEETEYYICESKSPKGIHKSVKPGSELKAIFKSQKDGVKVGATKSYPLGYLKVISGPYQSKEEAEKHLS